MHFRSKTVLSSRAMSSKMVSSRESMSSSETGEPSLSVSIGSERKTSPACFFMERKCMSISFAIFT